MTIYAAFGKQLYKDFIIVNERIRSEPVCSCFHCRSDYQKEKWR